MFVFWDGCAFAKKEARDGDAFGADELAVDERAEFLNGDAGPVDVHGEMVNGFRFWLSVKGDYCESGSRDPDFLFGERKT